MGMFQLAVREQLNLRMALVGPSGSGKTLTALKIAQGLAGDGKIAIIDTERGSARRYANLMEFYVVELDHYSPDAYIKAIRAADEEGFKVLIIDSLSHAWNSKGGILEMVDKAAKTMKGNSFVAWGDATPKHNQLIDAILDTKLHIIVTMRSKTEYVLEVNANGKTVPRKVGTTPIQRDGVEYEFDITADMDNENNLIVSKSRCMALNGATIAKPDAALGETLRQWAEEGAEPASRTKPSALHWSEDGNKLLTWTETVAKKIFKTESLDGIQTKALLLLDTDTLLSFRTGQDAYNAVYNAYLASMEAPSQPKNGSADDVDLDQYFEEPPVPPVDAKNPFSDIIKLLYVPVQHLSVGDVISLNAVKLLNEKDWWEIIEMSEVQGSDETHTSPYRTARLRNLKHGTTEAREFKGVGNAPAEPVVGGPKLDAVKGNPALARKNGVGRWIWLGEQEAVENAIH